MKLSTKQKKIAASRRFAKKELVLYHERRKKITKKFQGVCQECKANKAGTVAFNLKTYRKLQANRGIRGATQLLNRITRTTRLSAYEKWEEKLIPICTTCNYARRSRNQDSHGITKYLHGCRCSECKLAYRQKQSIEHLEEMLTRVERKVDELSKPLLPAPTALFESDIVLDV